MTHGKTYNKSPRRINHKATKSKTNTGITSPERPAEQTTGRFKAILQLANFTLGPDATLNTETHKNSVRIKAPNSVNASERKHKNQINHWLKFYEEAVIGSEAQPFPEEKETDKTKQAQIDKRTKIAKISSIFPRRGICIAERNEKHKNKITQVRYKINSLVE